MLKNKGQKNKKILGFACGIMAFVSLSAQAEREYFINPFGGYSFSVTDFNVQNTQNNIQDKLKFKEAEHYGLIIGTNTFDPGNIYLLYSHSETDLVNTNQNDLSFTPLSLDYLHLGGSLYYPSGRWQNYFTISLGLTQFRPETKPNFSNETRFSIGAGFGTEFRITKNLSLNADIRTYGTFVDASSDFLCNDSQCMLKIDASAIWLAQVNLGLKFTF